ncbi:MAG: serine hydrolase, partial [Opitutaceae bacterium]|nr:serine hydrolase [Verrucomicrobiales bacterium]
MRCVFSSLLAAFLGLGLVGCHHPAVVDSTVHVPSSPASVPLEPPWAPASFNPSKLASMDAAIGQAIGDRMIPGGVLWLERNNVSYHKAYGNRALVPSVEAMTEDTIFDAASLTKVIAGAPAMLLLIQRGMATLDDTVHFYIAEFVGGGKEKVTIRQLLTHTSGLRPDVSMKPDWSGYDKAIELACQEKLQAEPGTAFRYSDINLFLIGDLVKRISGKPLNVFVVVEIYRPLKMNDSGFLPAASNLVRIAPTEPADGNLLRGVVHDPTARRMGGVAGHAGLFTTASDLARFARMMLNNGELDGVRVFQPEIVKLMTSVQTPDEMSVRRGLGWDIDSGYSRPRGSLFPRGSYGHTGFTGTCLWIDPFSKTFWIFLSNRVHPDGKGNVGPLQVTLANLGAEAVTGFDFSNVVGALPSRSEPAARNVLNGIDVLKKQGFAPLKGLKVGLITNHTGRDREGNSTIDLLKNAPGVELKVLFSPEHGIRGAVDAAVKDSVDEKTGLPVYSLYATVPKRPDAMSDADYDAFALGFRQPSKEQLSGIDALVFDIQDIGCRFYTYMSTMGGALEAA